LALQDRTTGADINFTTGQNGAWSEVEVFGGTLTAHDDTVIAGELGAALYGGAGWDHLTLDYSGLTVSDPTELTTALYLFSSPNSHSRNQINIRDTDGVLQRHT
ncbi:hypothetical protein MWU61_19685, partial [Loktanella sp. F6476L]|uniref:hypothetical protein n=1 Tax=Loktanella sp. F6476L TaxID=2926405 RepID=UPI001FF64C2A